MMDAIERDYDLLWDKHCRERERQEEQDPEEPENEQGCDWHYATGYCENGHTCETCVFDPYDHNVLCKYQNIELCDDHLECTDIPEGGRCYWQKKGVKK